MKLTRAEGGRQPAASLRRLGYEAVRQRCSHVRTTTQTNGEHHEVIPLRNPIGAKTLSSILKSIAKCHDMSIKKLLRGLDFTLTLMFTRMLRAICIPMSGLFRHPIFGSALPAENIHYGGVLNYSN